MKCPPSYVELQATSNFSFLRGASHPDELAVAAAALGHAGVAVTDRNSLAGVVRGHLAAKQAGIRYLVGARLDLMRENGGFAGPMASFRQNADELDALAWQAKKAARPAEPDGFSLLCFPTGRAAYGRLCRLLSLGRRRAPKGECRIGLEDVFAHGEGQLVVALPPERPDAEFSRFLAELASFFRGRCWLAASFLYRGDDRRRLAELASLSQAAGAPLVATNDVLYHEPERRRLQDVVTCIRHGCTLREAGFRLHANAERHLKPAEEMARLFAGYPGAVERTVEIAEACRFSLDELRYEYPAEPVPEGLSAQRHLERLTRAGAATRYPAGVPGKVQGQLAHELKLIGELGYAAYFLTVHDLVRFANSKGILCQGRGSAANSVVCYCLGFTSADPEEIEALFERFLSVERKEPPDIDVDFEHERREEVIQYVYEKYGRNRAGLAATVIAYRSKSAIREVGKVFGLSLDAVGALADGLWGWGEDEVAELRVREAGLDPADRAVAMTLALARELIGFPRHLSQHVGGFVITAGPLSELCPIENAAMEERTVVQWDKDDLSALGILKIDVLALGMLTCIAKGFALIEEAYGARFELATVPRGDPAVYDMLCEADSIGVFQVESRAQMSMLPRLRPRTFYDLVIEVAIVRPGPIQGDMVHPYLRRRNGEEAVDIPPGLEAVLRKTLGVPLFQEQAMKIAMVAAGFTAAEADGLRRAMATFKRSGAIHTFGMKMVEGMVGKGYERDFAERCFRQIEGFGEYGFPESHAASFARLVYVSAWMKRRYPAVFAAALLNSQPMGFYAPAQIVRDAIGHGVEVRPVDVNHSLWDCTLEPSIPPGRGDAAIHAKEGAVALRLGLRQISGFAEAEAEKLVAGRGAGYENPRALWRRAGLKADSLRKLAEADAWRSAWLDRRQALWALKGLGEAPPPLLAAAERHEPAVALPEMRLGEHVIEDYQTLKLSLKAHPVSFLRAAFGREGIVPAKRLADIPAGRIVTVAGLVLVRQRPATASGIVFITLEDETGIANLIVRPDLFEANRRTVLGGRLIAARGKVEREGIVIHVLSRSLFDLSDRLSVLREAAEVDPSGRGPRDVMPRGRNFR